MKSQLENSALNYWAIFKSLINRPFAKDFSKILSAVFLCQFISLLVLPIVARFVGPQGFGEYNYYLSYFILVSTFSTGKFEQAILLGQNASNAQSILSLTLRVSFIISLVVPLFFFALSSYFAPLSQFSIWFPFLIVAIFSSGLYTAIYYYANWEKNFQQMASMRMYSTISLNIMNFISAISGFETLGLITGHFCSFLFPCVPFIKDLSLSTLIFREPLQTTLSLGSRFKNFPLFSVPAEFIGNFSRQLPLLFLGNAVGATAVAHFALTQRIVGLPMNLITSSLGDVLRERLIREQRYSGNCLPLFLKISLLLAALALLPFSLLYYFSAIIIAVFFGSNWSPSSIYLQWLIPSFFLRFIVSPVSYVFLVFEEQKTDLLLHIGSLLIVATGMLIGHILAPQDIGMVKGFAISSLVSYILYYIFTLNLVIKRRGNKNVGRIPD